jgi:uncharacterized lipoprotein
VTLLEDDLENVIQILDSYTQEKIYELRQQVKTRHCDWNSPFFFTKNNKECTKKTHDFLVGTRQNFYIQESLQEENHSVKSQKIYF